MKLSIAKFFPAHSTNYTRGRSAPVDRITIHHTAGFESTLRYLWQNAARNASSHFFVHPNKIEQYVDTDDTAWTNSSHFSNTRAITIEVRGDWRGYYDAATLRQLRKLLIELRRHYPEAKLTYHIDEKQKYGTGSTLCPADLKHKGYAKKEWDAAGEALHQPKPSPIKYKAITPKRVILKRAANLWNFNFNRWSDAKAVKQYPKGHVVDVVAVATNALGAKYYMTAYSHNNGNIRATHGFNVADVENYVPPKPPEPTPDPKPDPDPEPQPEIKYEEVDMQVELIDDASLWNFDFEKWSDAEAVKQYKKGHTINVAAIATNKLGGKYYVTPYSYDGGNIRTTYGFNVVDAKLVKEEDPKPVPQDPIDDDTEHPSDSDVVDRLSALEKIVQVIKDFLEKVFNIKIGE